MLDMMKTYQTNKWHVVGICIDLRLERRAAPILLGSLNSLWIGTLHRCNTQPPCGTSKNNEASVLGQVVHQ